MPAGSTTRTVDASRFVGAFVVDPRLVHLHRPGSGGHLPRLVIPVAHHQAVTVLVDLALVGVDVGVDLGLQRNCEHLLGAVAGDGIQQRLAGGVFVYCLGVVDYLEHGRNFPNQRSNAGSLIRPW